MAAPARTGAQHLNVFGQPLAFFSSRPLTGFYRDGYCRVGGADFGNHAVAGIVTEEFLDFTASQGNDLRIAGLTGGCKWCLCASRWKEAWLARTSDADPKVPKIQLAATHQSALREMQLSDMQRFAVDAPATNGANGTNGVNGHREL